MADIDELLAKLREVKFGDAVLSADHNDLVDVVEELNSQLQIAKAGYVKSEFYGITNEFTVSKTLTPQYDKYGVCKYAKRLGKIFTGAIAYFLVIKGEMKVSQAGLRASIYSIFHNSAISVGQTYQGVGSYAPNILYTTNINNNTTAYVAKAIRLKDSEGSIGYFDNELYYGIWAEIYKSVVPPIDAIGYYQKVRGYADARPIL